MENNIRKRIYLIALTVLLLIQSAVMVYYGSQKQGMHEDEYYTYYSSNRTNGFFYPDRTWIETAEIKKEFMVLPSERFQFDMVRQVQSWDVHPPLYYQIFHAVCSFSPGVFSKWQGILTNLTAFLIGQVLLYSLAILMGRALPMKTADMPALTGLLAAAAWGFSPAAVSMVMFIRMYAWLTMFVLTSIYCHLLFLNAKKRGVCPDGKSARPESLFTHVFLILTTIAGFLTHYYFAVYLFFAGIVTVAVLWHRRNFRSMWTYIIGQGAALCLDVLFYPAAVSHILHGYRGKEAQTAFFQADNLLLRWKYFAGLIRKMVLGNAGNRIIMAVMILTGAVLSAALIFRRKEAAAENVICPVFLLAVSAGYFAVVSKTALMLGDSSVRYLLPVCPLVILIVIYIFAASAGCIRDWLLQAGRGTMADSAVLLFCICSLLLIARNVYGLSSGNVLFLYPEDREKIARAAESSSIPTAAAFDPEAPYNMWFLTDELLEHDRIYLIDLSNPEAPGEEFFGGCSEALIYTADHINKDEFLANLGEAGLAETEDSEAMWTLVHMEINR